MFPSLTPYLLAIKIAAVILLVGALSISLYLLKRSNERALELEQVLEMAKARAELCSSGVDNLKKEQDRLAKDLRIQIGRQKAVIDFYTSTAGDILTSKPMGKNSCDSANILIDKVIVDSSKKPKVE